MTRERATAVAAGLVAAAYNVTVNRVLPTRTHVPANLAIAAGLCGLAHAGAHASWSDLGLDFSQRRCGLRVGIGSSLAAAGLVATAAAAPATRRFFADDRVLDSSRGQAAYELLVRIPFATALPEEVVFRGVLLGVLSRSHTAITSIVWTSALFGLWHVLPTLDTLRTNPIGEALPSGWLGKAAATGGTTVATGATGVVLALLRSWTGSLVAPFLVHTTINTTAYVGGRLIGGRVGQADRGRSAP